MTAREQFFGNGFDDCVGTIRDDQGLPGERVQVFQNAAGGGGVAPGDGVGVLEEILQAVGGRRVVVGDVGMADGADEGQCGVWRGRK